MATGVRGSSPGGGPVPATGMAFAIANTFGDIMNIEEQRKLVDGMTLRAERQFNSLVFNGNEIDKIIDIHIMCDLSKEIAKLQKMEDAKREENYDKKI